MFKKSGNKFNPEAEVEKLDRAQSDKLQRKKKKTAARPKVQVKEIQLKTFKMFAVFAMTGSGKYGYVRFRDSFNSDTGKRQRAVRLVSDPDDASKFCGYDNSKTWAERIGRSTGWRTRVYKPGTAEKKLIMSIQSDAV